MSAHLVEPLPKGWGSWEECVKESGVLFTDAQFELGSVLIERSEPPELRPHVLNVYDYCAQSSVGRLLERPIHADSPTPVHPLLLLSLAAGIHSAEDSSIFGHMQYGVAMSPFLLSHAGRGNFIFLLKNDRERFTGEFMSLRDSEGLPRCTHVFEYLPGKESDFVFRKRVDGKYGPFYSR